MVQLMCHRLKPKVVLTALPDPVSTTLSLSTICLLSADCDEVWPLAWFVTFFFTLRWNRLWKTSLLRLPMLVSACFCFFCTVYAHLWQRTILELSEESPARLSSRYHRTSSWLDRRFKTSTGFHSLSCWSRMSASLVDWSCRCDVPWTLHVLVVGVWMLSGASTVGLETVEQESIQCREDCFRSQAALCTGLLLSPTSV